MIISEVKVVVEVFFRLRTAQWVVESFILVGRAIMGIVCLAYTLCDQPSKFRFINSQ